MNVRSNYPNVVREGQPLLALFTFLKEEDMETQECNRCFVRKPLNDENFFKHKNTKTKFTKQCKVCICAGTKVYREKNADTVLSKKKDQWLRLNFKRTPEWYVDTLESQGGHCALCDVTPKDRRFQVDHDHKCCPTDKDHRKLCGKCVRGLLCEGCNTRLGYLEKLLEDAMVFPYLIRSASWTYKALQYLRHYEGLR